MVVVAAAGLATSADAAVERHAETGAVRFIAPAGGPSGDGASAKRAALGFAERSRRRSRARAVERPRGRARHQDRSRVVGPPRSELRRHPGPRRRADRQPRRRRRGAVGDRRARAGPARPARAAGRQRDAAKGSRDRGDVEAVRASSAASLSAGPAELTILDTRILGGPGLDRPALAWQTEVTGAATGRPDRPARARRRRARSAAAGDRAGSKAALDRRVCDAANTFSDFPCVSPTACRGRSSDGDPRGR